jgi:hypothetical protein
MLKLFARSRRERPVAVRRFARPRLEALEDRYCPSGNGDPSITLAATVLPNHVAQLSGVVSNFPSLAGVTVTFSGAAAGSTTTDLTGHYSWQTSTASLGQVSAVGTDSHSNTSNTATATLAVAAPNITLTVTYGSQRNITLSGQVTGIDVANVTVTFTDEATGTTTTDANGNFSFSTTATARGKVSAKTTDLWGQNSNTAKVTLTSNAPTITQFTAIHDSGNVWTFEGLVTDESAAGLTVTLGGTPSLQGVEATVGSDGFFYCTVTLQPDEFGTATAQTTDWWGLNSNVAQVTFNS